MNVNHLPKSKVKLAWLAPWSFGRVTVLEYLFITGFPSSLIGEHAENALEDACTAYFLEVQTNFDMSETKTNSVTVYPARQSSVAYHFSISQHCAPRAEVPEFKFTDLCLCIGIDYYWPIGNKSPGTPYNCARHGGNFSKGPTANFKTMGEVLRTLRTSNV